MEVRVVRVVRLIRLLVKPLYHTDVFCTSAIRCGCALFSFISRTNAFLCKT